MEPEEKKLVEIAQIDSKVLLRVRTSFPFILFPIVISVDRLKITIENHYFFFSKSVRSIMIKDVMNVMVEETPLFSLLRITDRLIPQDTIEIANLSHTEAQELRRLIQGLMVTEKEGVDLTKIDPGRLKSNLQTIGKVNES